MSLLERVAGVLSRAFPNHISVLSRSFEEYPLTVEARVILELAQRDAVAYAQIHATPERTLLAALEDDGVASFVAAQPGASLEAFRDRLLIALASPAVAEEARRVARSQRLMLTLGHALERMRRRGQNLMSRGDLLTGLAATEGETARLLAPHMKAGGIEASGLDATPKAELPMEAQKGDESVAIYTLNDDVSTMEDVMRILEHGFDMSVRRAFHRMMTTHHVGQAHLGTYPRKRADELLEKASRHAAARRTKIRFFVGRPPSP